MKIDRYKQVESHWQIYGDGLRYYLLKMVKDKDIANELSHEVLIKVYNACCSGTEIRNIKSWLYQIAHNIAIDHIKKNKKITGEPVDYEPVDYENENKSQHWKELAEFLEPMIDFLPEKYARPLRLSDVEGLSQQQIADKLGLSLAATKSRILRARGMLKNEVVACFHIERDSCGCIDGFELKASCISLQRIKNQNS